MQTGLTMAATLACAWLLDELFGEPPDAWHPVAWLGRVLEPIGRSGSRMSALAAFTTGAVAWITIAGTAAASTGFVQSSLATLNPVIAVLLLGTLLKPCFAWRMLRDEVAAVDVALTISLDEGRQRVARLCSRDVSSMNACEIRETAIETLAENLNDSVVAPLFWFVACGLPGAVVYRFANTADAMWGYHGRYEWFGKWAARADDALSWLPARCTAALLMLCGPRPFARGLSTQAALTPSPNGGWPMGAMALLLNVRLSKPGAYVLNASAASPSPKDVVRALRVASLAAWTAMASALAFCVLREAWA